MTKFHQLLAVTLFVAVVASACGGNPLDPSQNLNVAYSQSDLAMGTGRVATNGNRASAHYTLWLYNPNTPDNKGSQIESSVGGNPYSFTLGAGQVIRGWDQGVVGMALGGKRRLVIPPSLAYGSQGSPPKIPSNATLINEIELVGVTD
jgi:FKBP-type peptidyl-prolyl cis-trans isomerase FkpA